MPKITGTNVDITGTEAGNLATKLKWFKDNDSTAEDIIDTASNNFLKIEVKNGTGTCRALSKSKVELDWTDCHQNIKELTETALFEINNAVNYGSYGAAGKKLKGNIWSLLKYGYEMAIRESPSSVTLYTILVSLGSSYTPSAFGRGHMEKNQLAAASTTTTIEKIFADSKQVKTATIGSDSLKSRHLYAYDAMEQIGQNFSSAGAKIKKITQSIRTSGGTDVNLNSSEFRDDILKYFSNQYTPTRKDYDQLKKAIVSYILALQKLIQDKSWTITWNGNGAEWVTFANEVVRVDSIVVGNVPDEMVTRFLNTFP